jgi:hypothetical protein
VCSRRVPLAGALHVDRPAFGLVLQLGARSGQEALDAGELVLLHGEDHDVEGLLDLGGSQLKSTRGVSVVKVGDEDCGVWCS